MQKYSTVLNRVYCLAKTNALKIPKDHKPNSQLKLTSCLIYPIKCKIERRVNVFLITLRRCVC